MYFRVPPFRRIPAPGTKASFQQRRVAIAAKSMAIATAVIGILVLHGSVALAQGPNVIGKWIQSSTLMPINPIHTALLPDGKIVVVSGSGNYPAQTTNSAGVWDPTNNTVTTTTVGWDMFCNGMIVLPDGRPFIIGGNLQYDPFFGLAANIPIYDPATQKFTDMEDMAHGRWYPTATVLGDGRVMTFSGLDENRTTRIHRWKSTKLELVGCPELRRPWTPPLYPRMHLLPNGKVFYSGWSTQSQNL